MKLPQLGAVKLKGRKLPKNMPRMVTVSKDAAGRYWTSFSVLKHVETIREAAMASVGSTSGELLRRTQQRRAHRESPAPRSGREIPQEAATTSGPPNQGSKRRMRTAKRIARLHARIAWCRLDFLHKVTSDLVRRFRVICVESLNVKGMMASAAGTVEKPG